MNQNAPLPDRPLISVAETARRLGVHVCTVRRWLATGLMHAYVLPSGARRIDPAELERILSAPDRKEDSHV